MLKDADYWIEKLGLVAHPEGGYFCEAYKTAGQVAKECLSPGYPGPRSCASLIYYLLKGGRFSALHRLKSDEIWHFYAGSPLSLFVIGLDGNLAQRKLGGDPEKGEAFQVLVNGGEWFGAIVDEPESFTLAGCMVAPGFEYEDFELGARGELLKQYPEHRAIIEMLTW